MTVRLDEYERFMACVRDEQAREKCRGIWQDCSEAVHNRILDTVPWPKYDAAWGYLHELRTELVGWLPLSTVRERLLPEIEADVSYLAPNRSSEAEADFKKLRDELRTLPEASPPAAREGREQEARVRLATWAKEVAQARQATWLKANMIRSRLAIMGFVLSALLVVVIALAPHLGEEKADRPFYLALMVFGAMGGLVSAVIVRETLEVPATEFYIHRRLLYLRPLLGAALGVVGFFAVRAHAVSIVGIGPNSGDRAFLVLAFAAGFAERVFIHRLIASMEDERKKRDRDEAEKP